MLHSAVRSGWVRKRISFNAAVRSSGVVFLKM